MVVGFVAGYNYLFGLKKMLIFISVFFFLSFLVHMTYRIKTKKIYPKLAGFTSG